MELAILQPVDFDRSQLVKLIRKYGDVNTDGLLEKRCQVFTTPDIEGFIGYKLESGNAVVFGDPVAAENDKLLLAKAFDEECRKKNLGIVYTIASKEFVTLASQEFSGISIEFGTKIILDPHELPTNKTGSKAQQLRKKVKHALNDGAKFHEYLGDNPNIEKEIMALADAWVKKRKGMQIYFSDVTLFKDRPGKRWFYATKDNKIVGVLLLNALEAQNGWLLNNIMLAEDAPNGLSELLIISTLEILDKEGCRFVLAGPIPAKELKTIEGLGSVGTLLIQLVFKCAHLIFGLGGHEAYWDKYQPQYKSCNLLFPHKNLGVSSIRALMGAFHAGN